MSALDKKKNRRQPIENPVFSSRSLWAKRNTWKGDHQFQVCLCRWPLLLIYSVCLCKNPSYLSLTRDLNLEAKPREKRADGSSSIFELLFAFHFCNQAPKYDFDVHRHFCLSFLLQITGCPGSTDATATLGSKMRLLAGAGLWLDGCGTLGRIAGLQHCQWTAKHSVKDRVGRAGWKEDSRLFFTFAFLDPSYLASYSKWKLKLLFIISGFKNYFLMPGMLSS